MDTYKASKAPASTGGLFELEDIVSKYGQPILSYCHGILRNYHDAQDAVQITFIKAHTKRAHYRENISLSAWLYRIAYNTCIDILRKRWIGISNWKKEPADEGSYQMDEQYMHDTLSDALSRLSAKDRALVFNRVIDGMSYEELAEIYKTSEAALRKRYERAKKKLATFLEKEKER